MTREEALTGHRKLWNEIADMIERGEKKEHVWDYKHDALIHLGEERDIDAGCYLCHYGNRHEKEIRVWSCKACCPVQWSGMSCGQSNSEYKLFETALYNGEFTQAAILARKIANLPERLVE